MGTAQRKPLPIRVTHWSPIVAERRWEALSPFFSRMLETVNGEINMLDLYELVVSGWYHVAVVDEGGTILAVALVRAIHKPRMKILSADLVAGDRMVDWAQPILDYLFELKSEMRCDRLELVGRPGWARVARKLIPHGVREKSTTLILEA